MNSSKSSQADQKLHQERFQPISVKPVTQQPLLFRLRCLIDLQLNSIAKNLRPSLEHLSGSILDVGAGQSPWRGWLPVSTTYQGIDVGNSREFGMDGDRPEIVYYDGRVMPFEESIFDAALCIEVLEHSEDPELLVAEIARVLKPGGILLLTVPWSARRHHLPHDYHRFTRERLHKMLHHGGFSAIEIRERSNDIGAIANKLTILTIRLVRPTRWLHLLWGLPLGVLSGTLSAIFILLAHLSEALGMGSKEDPLGYFVRAIRTHPE